MSEKQIPERWRDSYERCEEWRRAHTGVHSGDQHDHYLRSTLIEELGTAESLIRELAQALQDAKDAIEFQASHIERDERKRIAAIDCCQITQVLSRIPQELMPK